MGSTISRGALEWSRGKDLYMRSHILVPKKVQFFPVLYREGSRRFRSGAHLHGGGHMNVDSGERPHTPGLGAPRSPLKRNRIISRRDKIKSPFLGGVGGGEGVRLGERGSPILADLGLGGGAKGAPRCLYKREGRAGSCSIHP